MGSVYTREPGRSDAANPQRPLELLAAAEQAGWPPVYIQPEQRPVSPWADGPAVNVRIDGEDGWRAFVQLAGGAQMLAAERLLLCILVGIADVLTGDPDGPLLGPANDWGERFEALAHQDGPDRLGDRLTAQMSDAIGLKHDAQRPVEPYLVKTVGIAYGWDKASTALRSLVLAHWPNANPAELRFEPDEYEGVVVSAAGSRGLLHFFASQIANAEVRAQAPAPTPPAPDPVPSDEHVAAVVASAIAASQEAQSRTDGADYLTAVRRSLAQEPRRPRSPSPRAPAIQHGHQDARGNPYEHRHTDGDRQHGHLADLNPEERQRQREAEEQTPPLNVPVVNKRTGKPVELDAGHAE